MKLRKLEETINIFFLCICLIFVLPSCSIIKDEPTDRIICWLNKDYFNCLKTSLPCECQEEVGEYYSVALDISKRKIILNGYGQMEPYTFPIEKKGGKYEVLTKRMVMNNIFLKKYSVEIKNDSLILESDTDRYVFLQINNNNIKCTCNGYFNNTCSLKLFNVELKRRGHPSIEKILGYNNIIFDCNKYFKFNYLTTRDARKLWIVEMVEGNVVIKEVITIEKLPKEELRTKTIAILNW